MVSNFLFKDRDGQTPLPTELQKGLIPKHIRTVGQLDEFEEDNIQDGLIWLAKQKNDSTQYNFWIKLHKKLFGKVWEWAGEIRTHELSNPDFCLPYKIWPEIKLLEDNLKYWLEEKPFSDQEIAARFHEKIETIHPFANGNGRFGRIVVEYFCKQKKIKIPSWGFSKKNDPTLRRQTYISALTASRYNRDYEALITFMFS